MNNMTKHQHLEAMVGELEAMRKRVEALDNMDRDENDLAVFHAFDMHDQVQAMFEAVDAIEGEMERAVERTRAELVAN